MEYSNKWLDNIVCYSKQCYEIRTKAPPYTSDMQCIAKQSRYFMVHLNGRHFVPISENGKPCIENVWNTTNDELLE